MAAVTDPESNIGPNSDQDSHGNESLRAATTPDNRKKCSQKTCTRMVTGTFKLCEGCRETARVRTLRVKKRKADAMKQNPEIKLNRKHGNNCQFTFEKRTRVDGHLQNIGKLSGSN